MRKTKGKLVHSVPQIFDAVFLRMLFDPDYNRYWKVFHRQAETSFFNSMPANDSELLNRNRSAFSFAYRVIDCDSVLSRTELRVYIFNPLRNDKILDVIKLKAFVDDKIGVTQKLTFKLGRVER